MACPDIINCQVLARVLAAPDAAGGAAQGGIDDHLAGGRGLGIDGDRERRSPTKTAVAAGGADRQHVAAGINVVRAVVEIPGRPAVLGDQEADARRAGVALAGGGDDDRLVGVVIAREDRDPADVDAGGRAEVGERNPGWAAGTGREEVGRLPDAAAGAGGVDRVARGVGRVDGQAGNPARRVSRQGCWNLQPIDAGPTAVHAWLDRASVWPSVKMRKLALTLSLPGSPRPGSAAASGRSATSR